MPIRLIFSFLRTKTRILAALERIRQEAPFVFVVGMNISGGWLSEARLVPLISKAHCVLLSFSSPIRIK